MIKTLRFVLGDQLNPDISSLSDIDPINDVVLMVEVFAEASNVKHHKQKIVFVFSAMRHFADDLRTRGFAVDYVQMDVFENTQTLSGELQRAVLRHQPEKIVMTEPSEWRVAEDVKFWPDSSKIEIRGDDRFFATPREFSTWAQGRKQYRMEFFYREMRKKTGYLMQGGVPIGGQWNYDAENRKKLPVGVDPPPRLSFPPDHMTREVIVIAEVHFGDNFGNCENFGWAVTRADALKALNHFIEHSLRHFGDYQDAMKQQEDFVFHSVLSPYINFGLLTPREVCEAALAAWKADRAPLNAVEGFIRQIIGWREFVRGLYWHEMPAYAATNFLGGKRKLPWFYWSGKTSMKCLAECIRNTMDNAYAHHIQRLMVLGNFALLAGVAPAEIEEWFLVVYADALDWVELPNVHGMVMHADGGLLGSKPYVASGAYIDRMSDYCRSCAYDPKLKSGPKACPYNYLYWDFLIENKGNFSTNPRMAMPYLNLKRMSLEQRENYQASAREFLEGLDGGP